ncbi:MAG: T9SS type A sorting domain-containing protein [Bacteroidia bacterium]|nr:T9SS type A sorting domain-containing protein [Bacteroidia bacterium]
MKKIYTLAALALLSLPTFSQGPFWTSTTYKGAFPVTDGLTGTSSNNWLAGWTNWDPEITVYPAPTATVNANITTNTTWTSGNTYLLVGNIAVTPGNTLTIEPGTVIRGDKNSKSCLIIAAGAKINAVGTATNPIVFTSGEDSRQPADWGGVVLLGNGIINTACATCGTNPKTNYIEGFATNFNEILYGGNNNSESSGIMSYCRIEFAGVALSSTPNSELNSLTLGGVGSGTQIDHIQASFGGDDAFEFFGGAVDAKYLVAFRGLDDDFDTDFGHCGRIQFGLVVRDKNISDIAGDSNGFESDNFNPGIGRLPITKTVFSNITVLGPKRDGTVTLPGGEKFERGIFIRRNSGISIHNSIFVGWEKGLHISGSTTFDNFNATTSLDSMGVVKNTIIASNLFPKFVTDAGGANAAWYNTYAGANSIDTTKTVAQIAFVNAFPTELYDPSDFRLQATSSASVGADFSGPQFAGQVTGINSLTKITENSFVIYPNPANENTNIAFNISEANRVTVYVYDVLGNLVSNLSQENEFEKGNHTLNINTSHLSSGIYYISLDVNGAKETKKLIINK